MILKNIFRINNVPTGKWNADNTDDYDKRRKTNLKES
jgi:hypothetical protein